MSKPGASQSSGLLSAYLSPFAARDNCAIFIPAMHFSMIWAAAVSGATWPWRTTFAPILMSFSGSVVSDQCSTSFGNARVRLWLCVTNAPSKKGGAELYER